LSSRWVKVRVGFRVMGQGSFGFRVRIMTGLALRFRFRIFLGDKVTHVCVRSFVLRIWLGLWAKVRVV
jgi:hypothetical protein